MDGWVKVEDWVKGGDCVCMIGEERNCEMRGVRGEKEV